MSGEGGKKVEKLDRPMPRLRQFLSTLSIAIYPRLDLLRWRLCLQTMTPMGSEFAGSPAYALGDGGIQNYCANRMQETTYKERKMWPAILG